MQAPVSMLKGAASNKSAAVLAALLGLALIVAFKQGRPGPATKPT
jgi:hypothetical protein